MFHFSRENLISQVAITFLALRLECAQRKLPFLRDECNRRRSQPKGSKTNESSALHRLNDHRSSNSSREQFCYSSAFVARKGDGLPLSAKEVQRTNRIRSAFRHVTKSSRDEMTLTYELLCRCITDCP
ncbi:hypothetical protein K0M31_013269 [Melipona bicolor]|uniref:Uncharacterized protein n=1 Tax=Melipona bicolor TaxID=60889 RepID=A0AA40FI07_9HYME|nr:hypothetical protein K0M31_013269 [Melipona bicolor]